MMKNENADLIERYLYAVTRRLSPKIRDDVADELRTLIDDMLAARCGTQPPTQKDVRVVLTELGSPQEVYEKYDTNSQKCLIAQPYYSVYILLLKIVLSCTALGLSLASLMLAAMNPQPWYQAVGTWLALLFKGLFGCYAALTLVFAVLSRRGVQLGEPFNFDDLPPVPKNRKRPSRADSIAGICFCVLFLIVFLAVPEHLLVYRGNGVAIPILSAAVLREYWYFPVLFALLGVAREIVRLLAQRYTYRVMLSTLVANALSAVAAVCWLTRPGLVSPAFSEAMLRLFDGSFPVQIFTHLPELLLAIILFALVLDAAEAIYRTFHR